MRTLLRNFCNQVSISCCERLSNFIMQNAFNIDIVENFDVSEYYIKFLIKLYFEVFDKYFINLLFYRSFVIKKR